MSATMSSFTRSEPVSIPQSNQTTNNEQSYKDMIKQLAAQAPEPYGAIPPLKRKQKKKRPKEPVIRRLSHVENWLAVDSKESIPDEEDLKPSSPFRNFLSTDFLVLPLHMPPPSLSAHQQAEELPILKGSTKKLEDDDDDEDEDEEEEEDDDDDDDESDYEGDHPKLLRKQRSIQSFSKSVIPITEITTSVNITSSHSSSPQQEEPSNWIESLRRSLKLSTSPRQEKRMIPMPLPPKPRMRKRRSEATTQPRFNPETNTYTRDTRSNPDHLRMISAELNMMRARKLSSPLKPRGFLPRRTDVFIRGDHRRKSLLFSEANLLL